MMKNASRALAALLLLAACSEPRVLTTPAAVPPPVPYRVVLAVSDTAPTIGSTVAVTVQALPGDSARRVAGSFTARLVFDPAQLAFAAEAPVSDGALRVVNPQAGEVRLAGAAAGGFGDGRLVTLRFAILGADALRSLRLTLDELHDVAHADLRAGLAGSRVPLVDARTIGK